MSSFSLPRFFAHPVRTICALKGQPVWLSSFLILAAASIVLEVVRHPFLVEETLRHLPQSATAADRLALVEWLDTELPLWCALIPFRLLAGWGTFSAFLWLVVRAFEPAEPLRWLQLFSLEVHAEGILLAGNVAGLLWSFYDAGGRDVFGTPPWSLTGSLAYAGDFSVQALLTSINLFTLWYGVTVAIGVYFFSGFSKLKSVCIVSATWIVFAGFNLGIISLLRNAFQFAL